MDAQNGHLHFSSDCFNRVWDLLDKSSRSKEEDRLMREMAHASLYHWLQREDCNPTSLSIGLWQVSRVHAVLGEGHCAKRYAEECIRISEENALPPFYIAYGYEAATRAAFVLKDSEAVESNLGNAKDLLPKIESDEERAMLEKDMDSLKEISRG